MTKYEKAYGFNENNLQGARKFNQNMGHFFETIFDTSLYFNRMILNICDGYNKEYCFECKNRYNTMKQSEAATEISKKIYFSINNNKKFILFIVNDIKGASRNIPLHEGYGMKKIQSIEKYKEKDYRWISGDEIFKYLFPHNWKEINNFILGLLSSK